MIGGASPQGGTGGVGSPLLGALFVTMLSNGMDMLRISGCIQLITLGVVIIFATALDFLRGQRAR